MQTKVQKYLFCELGHRTTVLGHKIPSFIQSRIFCIPDATFLDLSIIHPHKQKKIIPLKMSYILVSAALSLIAKNS